MLPVCAERPTSHGPALVSTTSLPSNGPAAAETPMTPTSPFAAGRVHRVLPVLASMTTTCAPLPTATVLP